ncbi:MAG: hypothetical protein JOY83_23565, partial [Alphaproteobacteria bacterium]|nr:hypothetical protein [Alphaproteobacteria bacterium]
MLALAMFTVLAGCSTIAKMDESPADKEADRQADAFSTYLSARFAAGQNELPEAARYYAQSLKNDPGNAEVLSQAFFF